MNVYEIKGTGKYFDLFFISAENVSMALAKAKDIMTAQARANNHDEQAEDYIMSIKSIKEWFDENFEVIPVHRRQES